MNYWYISHDNEILIDMDKPATSIPHAERRLIGAMRHGQLDVMRVEIHDSFTPHHVHAMITLASFMPAIPRMVWAIMFHSDIYRGCSSIMRAVYGIGCPDLVITPCKFHRAPDYVCDCSSKHNAEVMKQCPVAIEIRGDERLRSFFAVPIEDDERIFSAYERNAFADNYVWTPDSGNESQNGKDKF